MKKWTLGVVLVVFLSVLGMFATVNAAPESGDGDSPKFRLAGRSELVGYWRMVQMTEETRRQINKMDPWPQTYQWFAFYDDGRYNSALALKGGAQMTVAKLEETFAAGENNSRFEFLENHGIYRITQPGEISQYWVIAICDKALYLKDSRFEAGDLLMSLLDKNGQQVYYRQLRRMQ